MKKLELSAYGLAQRFVGIAEVPGQVNNPHIVAMLRLDQSWPGADEVPWCSAFVNYIAWLLRLPRSKSLGARSWLNVGVPISVETAEAGFDVAILRRGASTVGADVLDAPGHVGFFAGLAPSRVLLLGGNQGDEVNITAFSVDKVLGVRRLLT